MFLLEQKKNIDLSKTYVNMTDVNEFDDQIIAIVSDITTVPNGSIMQLNRSLIIRPNVELPEPWTFLFSAKFEEYNNSLLSFTTANQTSISIFMKWTSGTFCYAITATGMTNQNATSIDIDTTQFNHIAFEYDGNKLTLLINGKSRKSYNVDFGNLSDILLNVHQLHFVEYQVKNFSNDEVLI